MKESNRDWEKDPVQDWDEFNDAVRQFRHREWVFRGHNNTNWSLDTSLYRLIENIEKWIEREQEIRKRLKRNEREKILLEKFQASAHLYIRHTLPDKDNHNNALRLEWNAVMQHYGTPTRLLDVTFSPYIATYFALEKGDGDCRIYAFNHRKMREIDEARFNDFDKLRNKLFTNVGGKSFIIPFEPKMSSERLLAQQGAFLVPSTSEKTFQEIIDKYGERGNVYLTFRIPARLRYNGLAMLQKMNIKSTSLFPGIGGFCNSLRFEVIENISRLKSIS